MEISYKTYTVAEVRAWLYEGTQNGLSEQIITKTRANSIIHNPYVKDDMVIVVAAFDGDKVVGFTAMFPEYYVKPNVWVSNATTLYADPDYSNEFIGYNVTKLLHDTAQGKYVIGTDLSPAAVVIDRLLGLSPIRFYRTRFILNRKINITSIRSFVSCLLEPFRLLKQKFFIRKLEKCQNRECSIDVGDFFDKESYDFIVRHSNNCLFLRSHEMLNWIAKYPFRVETVCNNKSYNVFSDKSRNFRTYIIKVLLDDVQVGIFMVAVRDKDAHILLLYSEPEYKDIFFSKTLNFVIQLGVDQLFSVYVDFNKFVENNKISLKSYSCQFIYTLPKEMPIDNTLIIQGADGDMFA